jgi:hypothetical protein
LPKDDFTPVHKDKLFWCFFILLKGHTEYELHRSDVFAVEKQLKIETVEKLKTADMKAKLKDLKLKRTELENELVNEPVITLKGLYALCLVHNISLIYIAGRKYVEVQQAQAQAPAEAPEAQAPAEAPEAQAPAAQAQAPAVQKNIIRLNAQKEASLYWAEDTVAFLQQVRAEYWLIEHIQKPLNAPSAYTLKDLQDICTRLKIETHVNNKSKLKAKLYEEILLQN